MMLSAEFLLLSLCVVGVVLIGFLYLCCKELGTREKKKFRHTSFIIREKELEEVLASNQHQRLTNSNGVPNGVATGHQETERQMSKGDDFYSGRNTLNPGQAKKDDQTKLLGNMVLQPDPLAEPVHAGMAKPRVFGDPDNRVLGDYDRVNVK